MSWNVNAVIFQQHIIASKQKWWWFSMLCCWGYVYLTSQISSLHRVSYFIFENISILFVRLLFNQAFCWYINARLKIIQKKAQVTEKFQLKYFKMFFQYYLWFSLNLGINIMTNSMLATVIHNNISLAQQFPKCFYKTLVSWKLMDVTVNFLKFKMLG